MAGIGPAIDQDDAVFPEQPVGAAIVDEARDVELGFGLRPQIGQHRRGRFKFGKPLTRMRADRPRDDRELCVARTLDRRTLAGEPCEPLAREAQGWRDCDARGRAQQLPCPFTRQLGDPLGRIEHRARPGADHRLERAEEALVLVGFAHGHEGEIVVRHRFRRRNTRHDIEHVEPHVRAVQQELQRRVRHEVAGRHEGEQAKLVLARHRRGPAIDAPALEGAALQVERVPSIAVEVLDGREIHQDGGVLRLCDHPADQVRAQRSQVAAVERTLGETGEPDELRRIAARCQGRRNRGHRRAPSQAALSSTAIARAIT